MRTDLRQSEGWAKYLQSQGWEVGELKVKSSKLKVYIRKIPFLGSVIKIQRPSVAPPVKMIDELARKHRALLVKIEPLSTKLPTRGGFTPDSTPNLPTKTLLIDLTKNKAQLWKDLSQDARQSIKKARRSQLTVRRYRNKGGEFEKALERFHSLLAQTGRRQRFWTLRLKGLRSKTAAFGKNAILFLVYPTSGGSVRQSPSKGGPLAGALFLISGDTVYYHHAASLEKGRQLHAPYLLLWEAVLFFQASSQRPARRLDLEGIYDPRFHGDTRRWQGFTTFKRKFGGKELAYPHPLVKLYHPLIKVLFKMGDLLEAVIRPRRLFS